MSKLIFYYGTVSSSKSANLALVNYQYNGSSLNATHAVRIKPSTDGMDEISSRVPGLTSRAHIVLRPNERLELKHVEDMNPQIVLCDEAQFLTKEQVKDLWELSKQVKVICYGLVSNWEGGIWEGSAALFVRADEKYEITTTCQFCRVHDAKFNRKVGGNLSMAVEIGREELYKPACKYCFLVPEQSVE